MLQAYTIEKFGGLDLADDPSEIGPAGAVDLLNVWFESGGLRSVPNPSVFATAARAVARLFVHGNGLRLLASESDGTNVTLEAFDLAGASVASTTYASANLDPHAFASVGTPTASRTYAVRLGDTTRKWDGTAWSTVAAVPAGSSAAPADNGSRLAIGYAASNHSRVSFSDAGDPETFGADNYVDIAPGDGEAICDLVFWDNKLFAFKNTKFAVFTGVGIDTTGEPVFNYRMVDTGIGIGTKGALTNGGACAGPDGVYFIGPDGVYRTRGDEPQLISRAIGPLWPGAVPPRAVTTIPRVDLFAGGLDIAYVNDTLYVSTGGTGDSGLLRATYALRGGEWTYINLQENGTSERHSNFVGLRGRPVFAIANWNEIMSLDPNTHAGRGWHYQSGYYNLGSPAEKKIRYSDVYGAADGDLVTLNLPVIGARAADVADDAFTGALNLSSTISRARRARSVRGRLFAHRLSGSGWFSVSRIDHLYLPPGSAA